MQDKKGQVPQKGPAPHFQAISGHLSLFPTFFNYKPKTKTDILSCNPKLVT